MLNTCQPGAATPDETEEWILGRRFIVGMLVVALMGTAARSAADAPNTDYVRLHVIAEDDGAAAQSLKLRVRDAALDCARSLLGGCGSADAAWHIVRGNLPLLEAVARRRARAAGYFGDIRAEAGVFPFPDRRYGGALVPAGDYRALRVTIGEGRGRNWWCVLYPALCLPEAPPPGEPVRFHSILLDWLRGLWGGDA